MFLQDFMTKIRVLHNFVNLFCHLFLYCLYCFFCLLSGVLELAFRILILWLIFMMMMIIDNRDWWQRHMTKREAVADLRPSIDIPTHAMPPHSPAGAGGLTSDFQLVLSGPASIYWSPLMSLTLTTSLMWLWPIKISTDEVNRAILGNETMQVVLTVE